MKRMINQETIDKISELLEHISYNQNDEVIKISGDFTSLVNNWMDEDGNPYFPDLSGFGGKVVIVNEAETGFEYDDVSGGTQLYLHEFDIDASSAIHTKLILINNQATPIDTTSNMAIGTALALRSNLKKEIIGSKQGLVVNYEQLIGGITLTYIASDSTFKTVAITPSLSVDTVIPL